MKQTLLSLFALLALSLPGQSQSFTQQASNLGASDRVLDIQAIDANTAWGLAGPPAASGTYLRTTNGGATWQRGSLIPAGLTGYSAADLFALNATTAFAVLNRSSAAGGGAVIVRTTNGGTTWTPVTTPGSAALAGTQFGAPDGFANSIHFFDAQNGVCMGDPNITPASAERFFEVYTTSNGGTTWNRVPRSAGLSANNPETGISRSYCAVGNTIWFTTYAKAISSSPGRVFKSTDRGLTWTSYDTNIPFSIGPITGIAFANTNNGVAYTNGGTLNLSSDGGATWRDQTPRTPFRSSDVRAIPGGNTLVAVGPSRDVTSASNSGASISRDYGATWLTLETGKDYSVVSFVSGTVGWAAGTPAAAGGSDIGKYTAVSILASRNAALQKSLVVYPNPSATGIFTVQLAPGLKSGATVRVLDVVGRQVVKQELDAAALAAKSTTIDLSKEKAGVYLLELRTDAGVAQQRLVVE
ncbi:T9SS type A sorting domain-containing protein [Hymenobacter sp. BT664]|uniref:T9SS type A sorting domain-containing protein n=1 Tax=Hymenobacter montanus TaxID=2771359 RepID=A0A927BD58_9BACT|nr:T9SS type A sorting domain-containing protein [Hymenobacter montanus]MBD2767924.1 T9SS type A sorting domain-containing protein [Hymenobacter montanus]